MKRFGIWATAAMLALASGMALAQDRGTRDGRDGARGDRTQRGDWGTRGDRTQRWGRHRRDHGWQPHEVGADRQRATADQYCGGKQRHPATPAEPWERERRGPAAPLAQRPDANHDRGVETLRRTCGRFGLEPLLQIPLELRIRVHRATSTAPRAGRSSASRAARIACVALLRRDCIVPSGIARASADSARERPR